MYLTTFLFFRLRLSHFELFSEEQAFDRQLELLEWELEGNVSYSTNETVFETDQFMLAISLRRRATFYAVVLICPCVLLNILSLAVFTMWFNNKERETFAITLILTYFVFMALVVEYSPPSGTQTPLLGLYIILSTIVVVINFAMSVLLIEMHEHFRVKEIKFPKLILRIVDNRAIIALFTNKSEFSNCNQNNSLKEKDDKFLWKVLLKLLNFIFLLITILAHVVITGRCFGGMS